MSTASAPGVGREPGGPPASARAAAALTVEVGERGATQPPEGRERTATAATLVLTEGNVADTFVADANTPTPGATPRDGAPPPVASGLPAPQGSGVETGGVLPGAESTSSGSEGSVPLFPADDGDGPWTDFAGDAVPMRRTNSMPPARGAARRSSVGGSASAESLPADLEEARLKALGAMSYVVFGHEAPTLGLRRADLGEADIPAEAPKGCCARAVERLRSWGWTITENGMAVLGATIEVPLYVAVMAALLTDYYHEQVVGGEINLHADLKIDASAKTTLHTDGPDGPGTPPPAGNFTGGNPSNRTQVPIDIQIKNWPAQVDAEKLPVEFPMYKLKATGGRGYGNPARMMVAGVSTALLIGFELGKTFFGTRRTNRAAPEQAKKVLKLLNKHSLDPNMQTPADQWSTSFYRWIAPPALVLSRVGMMFGAAVAGAYYAMAKGSQPADMGMDLDQAVNGEMNLPVDTSKNAHTEYGVHVKGTSQVDGDVRAEMGTSPGTKPFAWLYGLGIYAASAGVHILALLAKNTVAMRERMEAQIQILLKIHARIENGSVRSGEHFWDLLPSDMQQALCAAGTTPEDVIARFNTKYAQAGAFVDPTAGGETFGPLGSDDSVGLDVVVRRRSAHSSTSSAPEG